MGKTQDLEPHIVVQPSEDADSLESRAITVHEPAISQPNGSKSWVRIALYTLLVISGQSAAILFGRLYYTEGGKSKWIATLAQLIGFPILSPYYCTISPSKKITTVDGKKRPSLSVLAFIYTSLGLLLAANNLMYSVGLLRLPVSLFSLVCVSQLAFNALFSSILNSQKFTPCIVNALFLLAVSSGLVLFNTDAESPGVASKEEFMAGLVCAVGSSAGYGLMLSLTQLSFEKVLITDSLGSVLEMIVCQSSIATLAATLGLFVSGEWRGLRAEMEEFRLGTGSYFATLGGAAVAWQVFAVGTTGLVLEVSSLFSNVIGVLGLPFVSVAAVFFFNDTMDGLKATSMLLALWGFASYLYQYYLDDWKHDADMIRNAEDQDQPAKEISMVPLLKEIDD